MRKFITNAFIALGAVGLMASCAKSTDLFDQSAVDAQKKKAADAIDNAAADAKKRLGL